MRKNIFFLIIVVLLPALSSITAFSQSQHSNPSEAGRFYIRNFDYKEYDAHQQNWGIVQDERGIIYVGNNWGILEYDGVAWRHIVTDKNATVIAMDIDSTGVIYVGAEQGLGYLEPDSIGSMKYVSLEAFIPPAEREFADVWRVHATRHGVYFFTTSKLLLWANKTFTVLPIAAHSYSQSVRDTVYYPEKNVGLMRLSGGPAELVPGGEMFATERISTIFQFDDSGLLLVGTRSLGLYVYDGKSFTPFRTEADAFLKTNLLYSGTRLKNGTFAFGTIRGGAAIIDRDGKWLHKLDTATGLRDQTIISCFVDGQGALWLSLVNGLARVETATPFTRFGSDTGLEGGVESIVRHKGILYAATHRGVYYLDSKAPGQGNTSFQAVAGLSGFSWQLFSEAGLLLAATDAGVYEIKGATAFPLEAIQTRAFSFHRPAGDDKHLFVGLTDGVAVLQQVRGKWLFSGRLKDVDVEIRSMTSQQNGNLWLGTNVHGAFLVEALNLSQPHATGKTYEAAVTQFGQDKLPVGEVNVFDVDGRLLFGTERGIRYFDAAEQLFKLDSTYGVVFADNDRYVGRIAADSQKRVWIFSRKDKKRMFGYAEPLADGTFAWTHSFFRRIADVGIIFAIYPEGNGTVWVGGTEGIVRINQFVEQQQGANFQAILRRVTVSGDSVVFDGANLPKPIVDASMSGVLLGYSHNAMRFEFAATSFDKPEENEFQYKLEGFEDAWSPWTKEVKKDYTNLPENTFRFNLRARNIYGQIGGQSVFEFSILPPWYRSWWAYSGYTLLLLLGTFGFANMQMQRYQRKAAAAVQREKEKAGLREATLRAEAAELQIKAAQAEKEVEKEHMRSRIASDLHDEIGSNLSSISMISQMLLRREKMSGNEKKRLQNIQMVAQETANSMRDIVWFVNPRNDSMEKLFIRMRETANLMLEPVDFLFSSPNETFDFETGLDFRRNLFLFYKECLQNIVKHAEAGTVQIKIEFSTDKNTLCLEVKDDGVGFDAGAQHEGNGLRNFKTRAEQMGGEMDIESAPGKGTTLRLNVRIP